MVRRTCFLSYGRNDDEPFVEALRDYLIGRGVSVWWDRTHMEARGVPFQHVIDEAIRAIDRVVFVVGPEALASQYVAHELQVAEEAGNVVIRVLRSSDPQAVKAALQREHVYDVRGLVLSNPTQAQQRALDGLVTELKSEATTPAELKGVPTLPEHVNRRAREVEELVGLLLEADAPPLVLIAGMGGIGKSVLAGLVARNSKIRRAFNAGVLFTRRGHEDTPLSILNDLLRLADKLPPESGKLEDSTRALNEVLRAEPHLLVIDNVWTQDQVAAVANAIDGSPARLLLTTRLREVAAGVPHRLIEVNAVSPEQSRAHLADWVGTAIDQLPEQAGDVVKHCGGHLLALSLCGAFLAQEYNTWQQLVDSLDRFKLADVDREQSNYESDGVVAAMNVSLAALQQRSPQLVERYRKLATFGAASAVPFDLVAALWGVSGEDQLASARKDLRTLHAWSLLTLMPGDQHVLHDMQRAFLLSTAPTEAELRKQFLSLFSAQGSLLEAARRQGSLRQVLGEYLLSAEDWEGISRLLTEEDETGANAWFSLRTAHDETDQFLEDWSRISRAAARLEPAAQVRWLTTAALTRVSLVNRTRNTPWQLMCAAVRHDLWSLERATAALALVGAEEITDSEYRAMGLAELVPLRPAAERPRALAEFFEALAACDMYGQARAVAHLRQNLPASGQADARALAHAFIAQKPELGRKALEELLPLFEPKDLEQLADALERNAKQRAVLTRLMPPKEAREDLIQLTSGEDLTTRLFLWFLGSCERELLLPDELAEFTAAALADPLETHTECLVRLLAVASGASRRQVVPLLTPDAWKRLFQDVSAVKIQKLLTRLTPAPLLPGLAEYVRLESNAGWRAAGLARLAGRLASLLEDVEAALAEYLREETDFSGLCDLTSDFAKVWHALRPTTRAALFDKIASLDRAYRANALAPLFAVDTDTASRLARELLLSLRFVRAWHDVREPIAKLAPHLRRAEVELALRLSETGRDAGFEIQHAETLWRQLGDRDRVRAQIWFFQQADDHLNAPSGDGGEWEFANNLEMLSRGLSLSVHVLDRVRQLALRVRSPGYAAVCFAALAAHGTGQAGEDDWKAAEKVCKRASDPGTLGLTYARLAALAPEPRRAQYLELALGCEAELPGKLGRRNSWPLRLRIIERLPDGPVTSQRALMLIDEVYDDKLDSYAPELLPKCEPAALVDRLERFMYTDVTADTARAVVRALCRGGELEQAHAVAELHPKGIVDELASSLSLEQARALLGKLETPSPALLECLARHGRFNEALELAAQLKGRPDHFPAVARCCKHAGPPTMVEPFLGALSHLEASDTMRRAIFYAEDVMMRLPEPARLSGCRAILQKISKLPRQIAIPCIYLLSPVLISFQPEAKRPAAGAILDTIINATRWWPIFPREADWPQ